MLEGVLENYIVVFSIGIIIGVLIARYYYERTTNYSLGKIIEGVMISESVQDLHEYGKELDSLLIKMRSESDNLLDQIKRCRDIEKMIIESEKQKIADENNIVDDE